MTDSPPYPITLTVPGMGSDHCAGIVRKTLERLDGVGEIHTNIATHKSTWRSLKNGTFNMDVLISMGSLPP